MKVCPDEGRLQSFFDGELPAEVMEQTSRHIASCIHCTRAAREAQNENAIFLNALEAELSAGVPTEQLRTRITDAIAELNSPPWQVVDRSVGRNAWPSSLTYLFTPRRATAFAGILAVIALGSVLAAVKLRSGQEATPPDLVKVNPPDITKVKPDVVAQINPVPDSAGELLREDDPKSNSPSKRPRPFDSLATQGRGGVKLLPGEESYLRTIAGLDVGLKDGTGSMSPATRAEYERNLKLVDYAIAATRSKAKRSPYDPDAAEFMFAAYQSKIDLLSTMTETARLTQY